MYSLMGSFLVVIVLLVGALFFLKKVYGFKPNRKLNDRHNNIIEKILDEISFTATDRAGEKIIINKEYINKNLDNLVKDTDLSKFIL